MKNNTWYEIFESNRIGTKTLELCSTLTEAKQILKVYLKSGLWEINELHIDKWQNINSNSEIIKSIC